MVAPRLRSRSFRKVKKTAPGGRNVIHYRPRAPSKAHCGACGAELKGVPRLRPIALAKLSKTQKRPERPYGGVLCSACTRRYFTVVSRSENQ